MGVLGSGDSDGTDKDSANGFCVNSVARGDIRPSISAAADAGWVCDGKEASSSACTLWSLRCSWMLGELYFGLNGLAAARLESCGERCRVESDLLGVSGSCWRNAEPIPKELNRAALSNGDVLNSVVDGDMRPKASAASTSLGGWSGAIANSADRGDTSGPAVASR